MNEKGGWIATIAAFFVVCWYGFRWLTREFGIQTIATAAIVVFGLITAVFMVGM